MDDIDRLREKRIKDDPYKDGYEESDIDFVADIAFENADGDVLKIPGSDLVAGSQGTWIIKITNNHMDIPSGGSLHFISLNYNFAYKIHQDNPEMSEYVTLEKESNARLDLITDLNGYHNLLKVFVTRGSFKKGESFIIRIGDRRFGSMGCEVYWAETQARLIICADIEGNGKYDGLRKSPFNFNVVAHHMPCLFRLLGPTVARPNERFDMHLGVFDRHGNIIKDYEGTVLFEKPDGIDGLPDSIVMEMADRGNKILKGVCFRKDGVYRIDVRGDGTGKVFKSNPMVVRTDGGKYVYWGDIHAHGWGDESMHLMHLRNEKVDPLARHEQARYTGRLDFSAIGPMSFPRTNRDEIWKAYKDACCTIEEKGKYIPFLSYEAHPIKAGDRNVIFKKIANENLPPDRNATMDEVDLLYGKRDDVLLQVHIGGRTPRWESYRPDRERMLEIASGFGGAEWLLNKALHLGYKPALCGCSDLHLGLMGGPKTNEPSRGRFGRGASLSSIFNKRDSAYGQGPLTAVLSDKLERECIWNAFEQRSTYATTGSRMFIDFRFNSSICGSSVKKEGKAKIIIRCHGTEILDKIDLICGDYIIRSWHPDSYDFSISSNLDTMELLDDWLYVRVHQNDGNYGWTTPFYFKAEFPRWNEKKLSLDGVWNSDAARYIDDVKEYLEIEEDISKFQQITPVGIIEAETSEYALFYCYYNGTHAMSIRWYYMYEIPKIRYDWGFDDNGIMDDEVMYRICTDFFHGGEKRSNS